jgi:hypothetical protein
MLSSSLRHDLRSASSHVLTGSRMTGEAKEREHHLREHRLNEEQQQGAAEERRRADDDDRHVRSDCRSNEARSLTSSQASHTPQPNRHPGVSVAPSVMNVSGMTDYEARRAFTAAAPSNNPRTERSSSRVSQ